MNTVSERIAKALPETSPDAVSDAPRAGFLRILVSDLLGALGIATVLTIIMGPIVPDARAKWLHLFLLNSVISIAIGLVVGNAFRFAVPPLRSRFPGPYGNVLVHALVAIVATPLGVELAVRIADFTLGAPAEQLRIAALRIGFAITAIVVAITLTYERLREKARRDELKAEQARREALKARLDALQSRTNPHFLFNSLNTVASLIADDPDTAERAIEKLSGLFRYTLKGTDSEWVRVREELAAVRTYLDVEALRLGDRLDVSWQIAEGIGEEWTPPLVLQPLVENAVLHGIAPRARGGRLTVTGSLTDHSIDLRVLDDGAGPGASLHRGSGTSLADLRQRLDLVYEDDARLETGRGPNGQGFEAHLRLPRRMPRARGNA